MPPLMDHALRHELSNEVHARPPEALLPPLRLSYLAMISDPLQREAELRHVAELAGRYGAPPPEPGTNHYSVDLGPLRLRWERHTEFARYTFIAPGEPESLAGPALDAVPAEWVAGIPGETLFAAHVALLRGLVDPEAFDAISARFFAGNPLIGAAIAGGAAVALTDVRIHEDGFGRLVVYDRSMTPRQAGRTVQRLLEIDTYRLLALLAFPVARSLQPGLHAWEQDLARIAADLTRRDCDEPALLDQLIRLGAQIDSREADDDFRFSAATAYYSLVRQRLAELREERLPGLQTFGEFTERRLAPAMNTCASVSARLGALSERVARATQLLSTRVDIAREEQNQAILASMNRRAALQLRLQETVEGLSVAAITYYIVGLVGYAAKALKALGLKVDPDLVMGVSIPFTVALAALGIRRIRKRLAVGPEH